MAMTNTRPLSLHTRAQDPAAKLALHKMPGHWLLARLGKRVLRPGGLRATQWLLENLHLGEEDDVVELAPGLGSTAALLLARRPRSYVGVDRDPEALRRTEAVFGAPEGSCRARVLRSDATDVPLPAASASLVIAEALLSMQPHPRKLKILREASRLLRPGARHGLHELVLNLPGAESARARQIEQELSQTLRVGVRIGTVDQWSDWLATAGLRIDAVECGPMRLLEPSAMLEDEGLFGCLRIIANTLQSPAALQRVVDMLRVFRRHEAELGFIAAVSIKR